MRSNKGDNMPLVGKVLMASCLVALGTSMASESTFTMTILSVTVLTVISVFLEEWRQDKGWCDRVRRLAC